MKELLGAKTFYRKRHCWIYDLKQAGARLFGKTKAITQFLFVNI
jgi:hypothetical protein